VISFTNTGTQIARLQWHRHRVAGRAEWRKSLVIVTVTDLTALIADDA
jgi:hypothetical protein